MSTINSIINLKDPDIVFSNSEYKEKLINNVKTMLLLLW